MIDINNLVDGIRSEVEEQNKRVNSSIDPRILSLKKGVKYRGRFIPKQKGTFVPYEEVGLQSRTTGQYVSFGRAWSDPALNNKGPDIIHTTQWDEYTKAKDRGDDEGMKATYKLIPQRKMYVNFFLTEVDGDDSDAKTKIGTVCAVRVPAGLNKDKTFRSKLAKDINEGLLDPKFAKKIGKKGFLLPDTIEDGIDFVFDVEEKGGYPNYDNSKFDLIADESTVKLTKDQVMDILTNKTIDLEELVPALKSQEELKILLDQHWYGTSASLDDDDLGNTSDSLKSLTSGLTDDDDVIPMTHKSDADFDSELDDLLK
jgi:hypothetical protein